MLAALRLLIVAPRQVRPRITDPRALWLAALVRPRPRYGMRRFTRWVSSESSLATITAPPTATAPAIAA